MAHIQEIYKAEIDLSSEKKRDQGAKELLVLAKPLIDSILDQFRTDSIDFPFEEGPPPFEKIKNSGTTGQSGLYLILNPSKKKVYLGGAADLAQRKGEHKLNMSQKNRWNKLSPPIRQDFQSGCTLNNFFFVPLLAFSNVQGLASNGKTRGGPQQIAEFLDQLVEQPLLTTYFNDPNLKDLFYNTKTIGQFQPGCEAPNLVEVQLVVKKVYHLLLFQVKTLMLGKAFQLQPTVCHAIEKLFA